MYLSDAHEERFNYILVESYLKGSQEPAILAYSIYVIEASMSMEKSKKIFLLCVVPPYKDKQVNNIKYLSTLMRIEEDHIRA